MSDIPKSATLGAAGAKVSAQLCNGYVTIALTSNASFVGTVKLQRRPRLNNGVAWATADTGWIDMASYTAVTVDGTDDTTSNYIGGEWEVRLYVSAYTSGSLTGVIGATSAP